MHKKHNMRLKPFITVLLKKDSIAEVSEFCETFGKFFRPAILLNIFERLIF